MSGQNFTPEANNPKEKPGTSCEPSMMPQVKPVLQLTAEELSEHVRREVEKVFASLPFLHVTCITVERTSKLLQCYPDTVRSYIRSGALIATRLGKDYRIRIADLDRFLIKQKAVPTIPCRHHKLKKVS